MLKDKDIRKCRKRSDEEDEILEDNQLVLSTVGGKSALKVSVNDMTPVQYSNS